MNSIAVIGTGNLGTALVEGVLQKGMFSPQNIYATRNRISKINHLKEQGVQVTTDNTLAVQNAQMIVLSVKPYKLLEVLEEIKPFVTPDHVLISTCTGITIAQMREVAGDAPKLLRAMPNTAMSVNESVTCIASELEDETLTQKVSEVFGLIGKTILIKEELMDAATVIGACGIAYVLRFMRAMMQGGIEIGFDAQTAHQLVSQTVKGAAELLVQNGLHPEQEIDKVTTPKGCTIAGLNEMEHQGFSSALIKGIKTSYEKI